MHHEHRFYNVLNIKQLESGRSGYTHERTSCVLLWKKHEIPIITSHITYQKEFNMFNSLVIQGMFTEYRYFVK